MAGQGGGDQLPQLFPVHGVQQSRCGPVGQHGARAEQHQRARVARRAASNSSRDIRSPVEQSARRRCSMSGAACTRWNRSAKAGRAGCGSIPAGRGRPPGRCSTRSATRVRSGHDRSARPARWICQPLRSSFFCSSAKKHSKAALSPAAPTLPFEPTRPWRARVWTYLRERNWLPRSECTRPPWASPRRATALVTAATARSEVMRACHSVRERPPPDGTEAGSSESTHKTGYGPQRCSDRLVAALLNEP